MPSGKNLLKNSDGTARINGVMQLIEEIEIAGAAVTTQDFATVLDGDVDGGYMIEMTVLNGAAAYSIYRPRINGAVCQTTRSRIFQTSTSLTGVYQTAAGSNIVLAFQSTTATGKQGSAIVTIPVSVSGLAQRFCTVVGSRGNDNTNRVERVDFDGIITTPSAAINIVSIGVMSDTASGIGIGSVFRFWRLNNAN